MFVKGLYEAVTARLSAGKKTVRVLYAGTGLLFLAYVGSRFVMEVFLGRMA